MKTAVFSWFGYYMPFTERLARIKQAGFDGAMISWEDELAPFTFKRQNMPEAVHKTGLVLTNAHASFSNYNRIWAQTPEQKKDYTARFVQWIKECGSCGVPVLVIHTNEMDLGGFDYENGIAFYSEIAEAAEKYEVDIAVENVSRQYLLRYVLDNIKSPRIGFCYDCSHDFMLPCARGRILKDYAHRLKALHMSDNDLHQDRHWIPGEGQIDYTQIMPLIKQSGFDTVSLEISADRQFWGEDDAQAFLAAANTAAKSLIESGTAPKLHTQVVDSL